MREGACLKCRSLRLGFLQFDKDMEHVDAYLSPKLRSVEMSLAKTVQFFRFIGHKKANWETPR